MLLIDLGKHASFIWSSYGIFTVVLLGLIVWLIADGRAQARAIRDLEDSGVRRRSARDPEAS